MPPRTTSSALRIGRLLRLAVLLLLALFPAAGQAGELLLARVEASTALLAKAAGAPREVALQSGNTLEGTVVDDAGMPQANFEVWIARDEGPALRTRTDASGRFSVPGLLPGLYNIDTPCGGGKFRLWEAKDAPRDAQSNVLLVVCVLPTG